MEKDTETRKAVNSTRRTTDRPHFGLLFLSAFGRRGVDSEGKLVRSSVAEDLFRVDSRSSSAMITMVLWDVC